MDRKFFLFVALKISFPDLQCRNSEEGEDKLAHRRPLLGAVQRGRRRVPRSGEGGEGVEGDVRRGV